MLKIFLFDLAGLDGILRAFSFIGLGLVLIGIGLVYQKFVFAPKQPSVIIDVLGGIYFPNAAKRAR